MTSFFKWVILGFIVYFFSWYFVYITKINTLPIQSEDTISTIFTTVSIVKNKSIYLDEYYPMLISAYPHPDDKDQTKGLVPFYLKKVNNHYLSAFPIVTSILAVPVFFIPLSLGLPITWDNLIILSHVSSALIMSLCVGFFYLLLMDIFKVNSSTKILNILVLLFAFGTINFAMFSQALWQFGALQLFLILGLYFSLKNKMFVSGVFSGIALITRPTSVLSVLLNPIFNIIFLRDSVKQLKNKIIFINIFYFILGLSLPILFFVWYNNLFYKDISNQGYAAQLFSGWLGKFPEGMLGIWVSPSKGILIFTPVFIFSLFGLWLSIKNYLNNYFKKTGLSNKLFSYSTIYVLFGFIVLTHTFIMGFWKHWYGGYGFGYRMAGDVILYLVLLIIPFIQSDYYKKSKFRNLFIILFLLSILIQLYGMVFFDSIWHLAYDLGYKDTSWLWSLENSEWVFNIRRVLVKFGLLYQACPKCLPN